MELCSKGHNEVCFYDRNDCPCCEKIEELQEEINDLKQTIKEYEEAENDG